MNCLLDGVEVEEMIEGIPVKSIRKKADQIREAVRGRLEITQIILIRGGLEQIGSSNAESMCLIARSKAEWLVGETI